MNDILATIIFVLFLYYFVKLIKWAISYPSLKYEENPPQDENSPQNKIKSLPCENCPWSKSDAWRKQQLHNVKIVQQNKQSDWNDEIPF